MTEDQTLAMLRVFDEIPAVFHRLRAVASDVYGANASSAGRRGILRSLDRLGPQTVPQLARARPVSRQHIQVLVNGLLGDGLIATEENPAHRKSPLVRMTTKGRRQLQAAHAREMDLLARVRFGVAAKEIECAADTLRSLCALLESKEWSSYVTGND